MEMESLRHPFPAIYAPDSRILILGSFPSVKSREQMFFYGHPQNRFWRVMAALLGADVPQTARVSFGESHCALGCDRLVRYCGFVRRLHPERCAERPYAHSGNGLHPADLHERRNGPPAVPEVYLPAHRAGGRRPSLHEPCKRRALTRRAHQCVAARVRSAGRINDRNRACGPWGAAGSVF